MSEQPAAVSAWQAEHASQLLRDGDPYAIAGWATTGINTGHSFAEAKRREHVLSYEDMLPDEYHPKEWVRVRCSGCPKWGLALEAGHTDADYRRLEAMHAGAAT